MTSVANIAWFPSQQIPTNDNSAPSCMSRERLEAESVLSQTDHIRPRHGLSTGLVIICALFLMTVAAFTALGLDF